MSELPLFITQSITRQYGADEAQSIIAGMQGKRCVSLRANLLKTTPEAVADLLAAHGIAYTRLPWSDSAFLLPAARESVR